MSARFRARRQLVNRTVSRVAEWATRASDVRAALVVGSYAYGQPKMSSDVDLVLLVDDIEFHLDSLDFVYAATTHGRVVRREQWGPMHERRVRVPSGLLIEFGVSRPSWVSRPVDAGTARVLTDGCKILYDEDLVGPAMHSLGLTPRDWQPVS